MATLSFIKKDVFELPGDRGVIKASEYREAVEAGEVLEKARREAERILEEARGAYEAEKKRGYEEGLEEGKGDIVERMMETVGKTVDYFATVEQTLCDIVLEAVNKIVGELDDGELVLKIVRNALRLVRNQKQVTLRVAQEDLDNVRKRIQEIMGDFPGIDFIDVTPDSRLRANGCVLESEIGVVDASLDVQLEAIRRALTRAIRHNKAES